MGFLTKENIVYVHCKLTDLGRKKIAEGDFNPSKFSVGDSEVNYEYFSDSINDIIDTDIVTPVDKYHKIKHVIKANVEDTVDKYDLINNGLSTNKIIKEVDETGFFSGTTYNYLQKNNTDFVIQGDIKIDISQLNSDNKKTLQIKRGDNYGPNTNELQKGDYVLINWVNPNIISEFNTGLVDSDKTTTYLWYKIISTVGSLSDNNLVITVDRDLPNFGLNNTPNTIFSYGYVFPFYNSMEHYYNSKYISDYWSDDSLNFLSNCNISQLDSNIWNLNILHIDDLIGITNIHKSKITNKSSAYAGLRTYINSNSYNFTNIGIIHFSNNNPNNIYGEKLEDNIVINLPTILWHKNEDDKIGLRIQSDNILKTFEDSELNYYNLIDDWNNIVGKVFPDLKLIIITDQELLYALSYKSNRNWTLNEHKVSFNTNNCYPDTGGIGSLYYGTLSVLGSFPSPPLPEDIDIVNSTEINTIDLELFSINIPFNSGDNDFIWLAIPQENTVRTKWFVNIFNQGDIGGAKNLNGNLFPDPEVITIDNKIYTIYISNYRTSAEFINFLK